MSAPLKWRRDKIGNTVAKARHITNVPLLVYADRAICVYSDIDRFEWYADEQVAPFRRWSQGVRTFATLDEAKEAAEVWVDYPGAWSDVTVSR